MRFVCFCVTYFIQYDNLWIHPCCYKLHYFVLSYCCLQCFLKRIFKCFGNKIYLSCDDNQNRINTCIKNICIDIQSYIYMYSFYILISRCIFSGSNINAWVIYQYSSCRACELQPCFKKVLFY